MQPVRQDGRHVLGGMNGEIELAGGKLLFQFQREQALAADLAQRPVGDAVARGGQDHDLEHLLGQVMRGHQPGPCFRCLRQRERAAARADPERFCLHPLSSVVNRRPW